MTNSLWAFLVVATATVVIVAEGRAVNPKPVAVTVDSYGNPVVYLRDKRAPAGYPQRTMMFTGYYRPVRRSNDAQATGVFAQGNAVSGGSYVAEKPDYLERGPEPIDDSGLSSSEAEAAPNPVEQDAQDEQQVKYTPGKGQYDDEAPNQEHDKQSADPADPPVVEDAAPEPTKATKRPTKTVRPQKTKKRPTVSESDEEYEDESDDDFDDDDEPGAPFIPFKSNRRRNNMPNLNNFFPMVFSFPRGIARGGSADYDSTPGMITAIANSYSTGKKGGVASSMATAYGGAPQGKKHRRAQPVQE
ncbi:uncharacterized protein [Venturia canescens]|uniref:uncharacterized protein n=1 Tax=Venturia canescens TaxID=32260 RepID=UPI001C9CE0FC|nr:uncharacterized protein LOC122417967 [Venturia canescens]